MAENDLKWLKPEDITPEFLDYLSKGHQIEFTTANISDLRKEFQIELLEFAQTIKQGHQAVKLKKDFIDNIRSRIHLLLNEILGREDAFFREYGGAIKKDTTEAKDLKLLRTLTALTRMYLYTVHLNIKNDTLTRFKR